MIKLQGKRNSAIVFADKLDKSTKTQICELLREEAYADSKIRIMPDTHSGKNVAVGTTMTVNNRISPSLVGVDIGCGMEVVFLKEQELDLEKLDGAIRALVPAGTKIHDYPVTSFDFDTLHCKDNVNLERALRSIGTLGGGNHFIELDRTEAGELVLVIHSGSRQLGSDIASYYQDQAYRYQCKKQRKRARQSYYDDADAAGFIRKKSSQGAVNVKRETAVLEGSLLDEYLHDLDTVVSFADLNRRTIAKLICDHMGLTVADRFACIHNYIDTEYMILRKGAISARLGERVVIPLNMRDGALLGVGKGNPEWNFSAPHGAGRACTRTEAKYAFTVEEFRREMEGIYTTTATEGSLDECPMAYKSPSRIFEFIGETVSDYELIKPIYNFKSC
ncbi:MAG: RtcB family protein [Ruminococcaceae bacterium]|nr:RtcB family protein [Oscillospiraceae bacterium]